MAEAERKRVTTRRRRSPKLVPHTELYGMDGEIELVRHGLSLGFPLILWGKPGWGKSTLARNLLHEMRMDPYILTCGEGLTEDRLFGGLDMRALREDGAIRYRVDESWIRRDSVILEELFDAPSGAILPLRNVLSDSMLRVSGQEYKVRTRAVVAITNHAPDEIAARSESMRALVGRFPMRVEIGAGTHSKEWWIGFLQGPGGVTDETVCCNLALALAATPTANPRMALALVRGFAGRGMDVTLWRSIAGEEGAPELERQAIIQRILGILAADNAPVEDFTFTELTRMKVALRELRIPDSLASRYSTIMQALEDDSLETAREQATHMSEEHSA